MRLGAVSSPAVELLASASAANDATIDFENVLSADYHHFTLIGALVVPANDGVIPSLRVGTGAGPTYQSAATDYEYVNAQYYGTTPTEDYSSTGGANHLRLSGGQTWGSGVNEGGSFVLDLYDPSSEVLCRKEFNLRSSAQNAGAATLLCTGMGLFNSTAAITALRFYFSTGNVQIGEFRLYGWRDA